MLATILWELRNRRAAMFWWAVGSIIIVSLIVLLFPSLHDQANQFNKAINTLPQGVRQLKTGGASSVNIADPITFLNANVFYSTLPMVWIILAITRGSALLGRDEQNHTLELLLSRPISRGRLLAAKAAALMCEFVLVGGITLLAIIALAPAVSLHVGGAHLAVATLYTALFSLSFGFIAFMLQAASSLARRAASAIAVILGFGGYLLASLSGLSHWLIAPARFAPYHYFSPDKILRGQPAHGLDAYLLGTLVITAFVSYVGFRRRDIS